MIQKIASILRTPPEESDLFLCMGVESLFFGTYCIFPPAAFILVGAIFGALAVVASRVSQ